MGLPEDLLGRATLAAVLVAVVGSVLGLVLYRRSGASVTAGTRGRTVYAPLGVLAGVAVVLIGATTWSTPHPQTVERPWWLDQAAQSTSGIPTAPRPGCSGPTPADGASAQFLSPCDGSLTGSTVTVAVRVARYPDHGGLVLLMRVVEVDGVPVGSGEFFPAGQISAGPTWNTVLWLGEPCPPRRQKIELIVVRLDDPQLATLREQPASVPVDLDVLVVLDRVLIDNVTDFGC